ncbi:MAG TPA: PP2C family protein-serine/threonine phosphatase [Leptospiraceae bacterium]|nr:PP2C family protein-serine/threonine phosphatase [Leptospiraceae bacterium]
MTDQENYSLFHYSLEKDRLWEEFQARLISEFGIRTFGLIEIDELNEILWINKYFSDERVSPIFRQIGCDIHEEDHPFNVCFRERKPVRVNLTSAKENFRPFAWSYMKILQKKFLYLFPLVNREKCYSILIFDFSFQEKRDHLLKNKGESLHRLLLIFSKALYISREYSRYLTKYTQFKNFHTTGLTLSKMYLNNTQEIIRMSLLTLSGIIDANVFYLIVYNEKYRAMTVHALIKTLDRIDIHQSSFEVEDLEEISYLFVTLKPYFIDHNRLKFPRSMGFTGSKIMMLPSFSLESSRYAFALGRNSYKNFSADEIDVLDSYSELAKITIDNSYLYHKMTRQARLENEVEIARDIQMNLIPRTAPVSADYEFAGFMIPAREIGGDYYDFLQSPDGIDTISAIGDVSGKGIPAGMVMATAGTILHSVVRKKVSLRDMLFELNSHLYHSYKNSNVQRFMSLTLLKFYHGKNKVEYAGAGHGHILIYREKTNKVEVVPTGGMILGIVPEGTVESGSFRMEKGDILFLFTDGATESQDTKSEFYGESRLLTSFQNAVKKPPREILVKVYEDIIRFTNNHMQQDDITLLCVKKNA